MNWGWSGLQDGWFMLAPEEWWIAEEGGQHRYCYYLGMLHDFELK